MLATLLAELIVTVTDQLRVMVDKTVETLGEPVDPAVELPVGLETPLVVDADEYAVGATPDVVIEVRVSGQMVVETAMTEV